MSVVDLQSLQAQVTDVLNRIQRLEEKLEGETPVPWKFLVARTHSWRRQLSIKGRNLTVGQLVSTVRANRLTPLQAGEDLGLPVEAIEEALAYYLENQSLIEMEAAEERRYLAERGYALETPHLPR